MSKTKTILVAGGVVSAAMVIGVGAWAFVVSSKASETRASVDSDFAKLRVFYNKPVFPNAGNLEIERLNGGDLTNRYAVLSNILARGGAASAANAAPTSGGFLIAGEETVAALRAAAPKDEAGNPIIPANFYFGFEKYDATKGVRPREADVPRLLKQLRLVDMLSRVFYDAGVLKIDRIAREEFEEAASADSASSSSRAASRFGSSRGSRGGSLSLGAISADSMAGAPVPVSRERFGFEFTTREAGLVRVLNSLNSFLPFTMVQNIEFAKITPEAVFPAPRPVAGAAAAPGSADPPGINRPPEGNAARIISGALRESPVKVVLTVDVYDFGSAAAAATRRGY